VRRFCACGRERTRPFYRPSMELTRRVPFDSNDGGCPGALAGPGGGQPPRGSIRRNSLAWRRKVTLLSRKFVHPYRGAARLFLARVGYGPWQPSIELDATSFQITRPCRERSETRGDGRLRSRLAAGKSSTTALTGSTGVEPSETARDAIPGNRPVRNSSSRPLEFLTYAGSGGTLGAISASTLSLEP
jgi:hypothetical protein